MAVQVHDVAQYVLRGLGRPITAMKLQKLAYYSQAWHLVWEEEPLFEERIEAWANGPVVPALYAAHRGQFEVSSLELGDANKLNDRQRSTVDAVLKAYGSRPASWLSELTHMEDPWRDAREGLAPGERGATEITKAAMSEYYDGLGSDASEL